MQNQQRIENLIRQAVILDVQYSPPLVRAVCGKLESDWLPWLELRTGKTCTWNPPTIGEQCIWFSTSGETDNAFVMVGLFSDNAPSTSPDEDLTVYPDGARVCYNHASGALDVTGIKTATVQAANLVTIDCPQTIITGDVLIKGKLTVEKLLTYLAGMTGTGGEGGATRITGDFIHEDGQLSSNGIVLHLHIHTCNCGETGKPL